MWQLYKGKSKKGKFTEPQVKARHQDGFRYNPKSSRWSKPKIPAPKLSPAVINEMKKAGDKVDEVAKVIETLKGSGGGKYDRELSKMAKAIKDSPLWKPFDMLSAPQGKLQEATIKLINQLTRHQTALEKLAKGVDDMDDLFALAGSLNTILGGLKGTLGAAGSASDSEQEFEDL